MLNVVSVLTPSMDMIAIILKKRWNEELYRQMSQGEPTSFEKNEAGVVACEIVVVGVNSHI